MVCAASHPPKHHIRIFNPLVAEDFNIWIYHLKEGVSKPDVPIYVSIYLKVVCIFLIPNPRNAVIWPNRIGLMVTASKCGFGRFFVIISLN